MQMELTEVFEIKYELILPDLSESCVKAVDVGLSIRSVLYFPRL